MVADSNSQIAWHRAQIKKHRETLKHLETGRFKYGQIAGAKSAGQIEKTVAELQAKIRESERIVATYERQIRRPLGTDFGSLKNTSWTNWSSHNGGGRLGALLPPPVVPANAGTHNHRRLLLKQSRRPHFSNNLRRGVWVPAFAGTTWGELRSRSRGMFRPSFYKFVGPLRTEGAGNAGCRLHPRSRVPKLRTWRTRAYRFSRNIPAFPAQWLYGLLRALPGERACCHRHLQKPPANLAPASRRQDHTTSPYAFGVFVRAHKTRLKPKRPSQPRPNAS